MKTSRRSSNPGPQFLWMDNLLHDACAAGTNADEDPSPDFLACCQNAGERASDILRMRATRARVPGPRASLRSYCETLARLAKSDLAGILAVLGGDEVISLTRASTTVWVQLAQHLGLPPEETRLRVRLGLLPRRMTNELAAFTTRPSYARDGSLHIRAADKFENWLSRQEAGYKPRRRARLGNALTAVDVVYGNVYN